MVEVFLCDEKVFCDESRCYEPTTTTGTGPRGWRAKGTRSTCCPAHSLPDPAHLPFCFCLFLFVCTHFFLLTSPVASVAVCAYIRFPEYPRESSPLQFTHFLTKVIPAFLSTPSFL